MKAKPLKTMVRSVRIELTWNFFRWYLKPLEMQSHGVAASNINNLRRPDEAETPPNHPRPLQKALHPMQHKELLSIALLAAAFVAALCLISWLLGMTGAVALPG